ncbi:MAG: hypothetical protein HY899_09185 [Deltaproteobacteria bacterium]|nr:hypothetical protein [Deltaproteobacteria bacterium]
MKTSVRRGLFIALTAAAISLSPASPGRADVTQDPNYQVIVNKLGLCFPGQICYYGRDQNLATLDRLRETNPELFENIDYGPVTLGTHVGVVLYPKKEAGQSYADAVTEGQVIEYTNFISDDTGRFVTRPWERWKTGYWGLWGKQGEIDDKGSPGLNRFFFNQDIEFGETYWAEDGPKYPAPPATNPDPGKPEAESKTDLTADSSADPNEKTGSVGSGVPRYVSGAEALRYAVFFENIGTAPAQVVTIEDRLDVSNLDLSTFSLGSIAFGSTTVSVPAGRSSFAELVDLRPDMYMLVRITAALDAGAGVVRWSFESMEPSTFQLPFFDGFLPPNDDMGSGQGHVIYTVEPTAGIASETQVGVGRTATIVFDQNAPIDTNDWMNTIDKVSPTSQVDLLAAEQTSATFTVTWSGVDPGSSGVKDYTAWVAEDTGPYMYWQRFTPDTSAQFTGRAGKTYRFYTRARDWTGNLEDAPGQPDATTATAATGPGHFMGYTAAESDRKGDALPRDCTVSLNDPLFAEEENYTLSKTRSILVPADKNAEGITDTDTHLLAYLMKAAKQGIGAPVGPAGNEKFPRAAAHRRRAGIIVTNQFGTLSIDTLKRELLLVPTHKDLAAPPASVPAAEALDHYECYRVLATKGQTSTQAPAGSFRTDLQAVVEDQFANGLMRVCAVGSPLNEGVRCKKETTCGGEIAVTSHCQALPHPDLGQAKLYALKQPLWLCNPVAKSNIDTSVQTDGRGNPRRTNCTVTPATVRNPAKALMCYQTVTARKVLDGALATQYGLVTGSTILQGQHRAVSPFVRNQLPNPGRVTTRKELVLCVPSTLTMP